MASWTRQLERNPIPALLAGGVAAVVYFTRRDLLEEKVGPLASLWQAGVARSIVRLQQRDGSWRYPSGRTRLRSRENYDQLETYRRVGQLVEKYGMTREAPALARAAERLFRFQTREGDFRGIYGNQYTPNYSAGILELLIKAGYVDDSRVDRGLRWLLSTRQDDGGWALPLRTAGKNLSEAFAKVAPLPGNPKRPASHLITGVVLRAFAAHPTYRRRQEAKRAGEILLSRFFKPDHYPDRKAAGLWTKFTYPFWFTDLLSSLDSLSLLGFRSDDPRIEAALEWFRARQDEEGLWDLPLLKTGDKDQRLFLALGICRVFRRFYGAA